MLYDAALAYKMFQNFPFFPKLMLCSPVCAVGSSSSVANLLVFSAEYGGAGLDFSYSVALNEQLGTVHCGGVPMAVAVQTDMSTPALAK